MDGKKYGSWVRILLSETDELSYTTVMEACRLLLQSEKPPLDMVTFTIQKDPTEPGKMSLASVAMTYLKGEERDDDGN